MFQRYVEIILKESIREMERKTGSLSADMIDTHIDELYTRIHDQAEADLAGSSSTKSWRRERLSAPLTHYRSLRSITRARSRSISEPR